MKQPLPEPVVTTLEQDAETEVSPPCLRCREGVHATWAGRRCTYCGSTDKRKVAKV